MQPHNALVTRQVTGYSEAEGHGDVQDPFRWDNLVKEFHDILDPTGMPVDRDTVHQIELLPNAKPHHRY